MLPHIHWTYLCCFIGFFIYRKWSIISGKRENIKDQYVGYILDFLSIILVSFAATYEQRLYRKHSIDPLEMIGSEGIIAAFIGAVVVIALSYVPCSFGEQGCVIDDDNNHYFESPKLFFRQL